MNDKINRNLKKFCQAGTPLDFCEKVFKNTIFSRRGVMFFKFN